MDAVSITGLQGTGKTTLARALGRALDAVVFSRDPLMDVLLAGGVPLESSPGTKGIGELGHELQSALLRTQLQMGRSVVLECVVGLPMREHWRNIAVQQSARFWIIDTICSDEDLHRERFEARGPTQRGDWVLDWPTVAGYRRAFVPHPGAHFVADATDSVDHNVRKIVQLIRGASATVGG